MGSPRNGHPLDCFPVPQLAGSLELLGFVALRPVLPGCRIVEVEERLVMLEQTQVALGHWHLSFGADPPGMPPSGYQLVLCIDLGRAEQDCDPVWLGEGSLG